MNSTEPDVSTLVVQHEVIVDTENCQTPKSSSLTKSEPNCTAPKDDRESSYLAPKLGAEFASEDHAYDCYSRFAVSEGFSVRKDFINKSRVNGTVVSRRYTCHRQGRGSNTETRTGCPAHMTVARQPDGKFRAVHFENDHNHGLATSATAHLLPSQKRLTFARAVEANGGQPSADPRLGLGFGSEEEAYRFYNAYAGRVGFGVRKDYVNRSKVDGTVVSRRFTCFREGFRQRDKRDPKVKRPRKETRIGCSAQLVISKQPDGKFRVTHFEESHNHELVAPSRVHLLRSQKRSFSDLDSEKIGHDPIDYERKLPFKRAAEMSEEEAGKLEIYFRGKRFKNPLFFYSAQPDVDDRLTNVFWAEAKMVVDYGDFGDVVCFDTTYKFRGDSRPLALFLGINHHKQMAIFGAALLYDETVESFEWLFRTFDEAMSGKKPKTILADRSVVTISKAIDSVFRGTSRRACVWHAYQNAIERLDCGSSSLAEDLSRCLFDREEEDDFDESWKEMLDSYSLWGNECLNSIYEGRENLAVAFKRNVFCADIISVLRTDLGFGKHLNTDSDVILLLKHVSKVVNDSHYRELEANYDMTQNPPRIMGQVVLLNQARDIYTPPIFELLQKEFEASLDMVVNQWTRSGDLFEYRVSLYGQQKEYKVIFDLTDEAVLCECMKFEFVGVLCSHALKVLDYRNFKLIPNKYILKRWTKNARV